MKRKNTRNRNSFSIKDALISTAKRAKRNLKAGKTVKGDTVIATDGAGSAIREAMMHGGVSRFNFEQKWLEHGYKELHIPPD